jgi:hypothetical protein
MLSATLSKALGISLSEVLDHYYQESDKVERGHLIGNASDRKRMEENGEDWLVEEAQRRDIVDELVHHKV